jgi:hypothetical protein
VRPFVSDPTTIGDAPPDASPVAPPFDDTHVAVNAVTLLPPSLPGVNATDTDEAPDVAVPIAGASGTVVGNVTALDAPDAVPVPTAFDAVTEQV